MAKAKDLPLFRGRALPPHFTPHQITDMGSKVFRLIQTHWRFGDAVNHIAHSRMIFKHNGDGRYEKLKHQIELYCLDQDFCLTLRAKNRPRNNHLTRRLIPNGISPMRLKPGIEVEIYENPYLPR